VEKKERSAVKLLSRTTGTEEYAEAPPSCRSHAIINRAHACQAKEAYEEYAAMSAAAPPRKRSCQIEALPGCRKAETPRPLEAINVN
jgi:hypothetical protein